MYFKATFQQASAAKAACTVEGSAAVATYSWGQVATGIEVCISSCQRRVALLVAAGDEALSRELLSYMASHPSIARYAVPDDVAFVNEIPHNATGKVSKLSLRTMFKDYKPKRSRL